MVRMQPEPVISMLLRKPDFDWQAVIACITKPN